MRAQEHNDFDAIVIAGDLGGDAAEELFSILFAWVIGGAFLSSMHDRRCKMSNAGLADAVNALDAMAAGITPNRAELMSGALTLNCLVNNNPVSTNLQLAALGLDVQASYGAVYFSDVGCRHAGKLAEEVRKLTR